MALSSLRKTSLACCDLEACTKFMTFIFCFKFNCSQLETYIFISSSMLDLFAYTSMLKSSGFRLGATFAIFFATFLPLLSLMAIIVAF